MAQRVVIIDDSRFLVKQIAAFFEKRLGFVIAGTGEDGADAVSIYRAIMPDLMTLDIEMPGKNGKVALPEIMTQFPDARILMIASVQGNDMLECLSLGARGFIEKPLKFGDPRFDREAIESINEALGGQGTPAMRPPARK